MKYVRIGQIQENALNKSDKYKALDILNKGLLIRVDRLLSMIQETYPDEVNTYMENLIQIYRSLIENLTLSTKLLPEVNLDDKSMLNKYPDLIKFITMYYLHLLDFSESNLITNDYETTQRNHFRSFLLPRYNNLQALIKTLGRESAIKFYKRFVTYFYIQMDKPENHEFTNLTDYYKKVSQRTSPPSDWVVVRGLMDDGKYFYMNENCLWVDALPDIDDKELLYLICCYGDYQSMQRHMNEHVILTMEHTIAQGDPYCSRMVHDTREDWDLRHPKQEFWDKLHNTQ